MWLGALHAEMGRSMLNPYKRREIPSVESDYS
jgi:hypothetical protein